MSRSQTIDQKPPCTDLNSKSFKENPPFPLDLTMRKNHLPDSPSWSSELSSCLRKLADSIIKCQLLTKKEFKLLDIWSMLKTTFKNLIRKSLNSKATPNNHLLPPIPQPRLDPTVPFRNLMFN